jgi:UDP-N-acetylglucosamine 1-carboxyvinyltransferase
VDKLVIEGGYPLSGTVRVSTAKNSVLPIMAASLLSEGEVRILDAPGLRDVATMGELLGTLGSEVERDDEGGIALRVADRDRIEAPYDVVKRMRASICVLGPILARRGRARVSFPGGCSIGPRPIDLHLKGLRALGAAIDIQGGYIEARAVKLRGTEMYLGGPFGSTVTGTANVLCAAVLAEGTTVIEGAACEPEVGDLARFLCAMGAEIDGIGTPRLVIRGVPRLEGATYRPIPDRIEAGTFMVAAAMTGGEVDVENVRLDHLRAVVDKLEEVGAVVERTETGCRVGRKGELRSADVTTLPYPGFPTDLQAQFSAMLSLADGVSVITEKVYPERFLHIAELARMRAHIRKVGPSAVVVGVDELSGAPVMASDLRASAALVLAGLVARGETQVKRVYHIDRGYERIEERLGGLGAKVTREEDVDGP